MAKPKKDSKMISVKMDAHLHKKLEEYCAITRLTKTAVLELALEEYLKKSTKES